MKRISTLIVSLMAWATFTADASDLRIRVFERGENVPLSGVSVCLGTRARLDQFGAARTDGNGYVLFSEVPQAQVVVTASLTGFKSEQETMVTSNTSRMLVMSLSAGGGGPQCSIVRDDAVLGSSALVVSQFRINAGAPTTDTRTVRLNNSLNGIATQYRASERRDMQGAEWDNYAAEPEFMLSSGAGVKRVYLQVRRHSTINGATLETVSPVVQDSIQLR
ncbi:MAG: carboxypeptidase regulatory-like domain-containing protein [Gammaproteobacteria bacterium]